MKIEMLKAAFAPRQTKKTRDIIEKRKVLSVPDDISKEDAKTLIDKGYAREIEAPKAEKPKEEKPAKAPKAEKDVTPAA